MKTNPKNNSGAAFWEGESCEFCGGMIVDRRVTLYRKTNGKHVLFENVPAGVCKKCGTRNFSADVLKTIQKNLRGRRKAKKQVRVDVFSL